MLNQDQITYSQQENKKHIWKQCEIEFEEFYGLRPKNGQDDDQEWLWDRYIELCKQANIPTW